jgi:hypothetical protein
VSEPQYDDQGAPAQDVPEADLPETPDPRADSAVDEAAPEDTSAEAPPDEPAAPDLSAAAPSRVEHTGNPVVDSVLDSLEELDRLPPSEHVAVFEAAHERLRGALSDAGEPPAEA